MLAAFLQDLPSAAQSAAECVRAFAAERGPGRLSEIRSAMHKLRGDAGLVDLHDIAAVCEKAEIELETCGQEPEPGFLAALSEACTWLETAARAHAQGEQPPAADGVLAALTPAMNAPGLADDAPRTTSDAAPGPLPPSAPDGRPPPTSGIGLTETAVLFADDGIDIADPELVRHFVTEANELLDSADEALLTLDRDPEDDAAIGAVFRTLHTIKGICAFLDLAPITALSHEAETLLDELRNGRIGSPSVAVDITFDTVDMLKSMVSDLSAALAAGASFHAPEGLPDLVDRISDLLGADAEARTYAATDAPESDVFVTRPGAGEPIGAAPGADSPSQAPASASGPSRAGAGGHAVKHAVRVDADKLDLLLEAIGELVIAESIVERDPEIQAVKSQKSLRNVAHLGKITTTLQDIGMSMRMVPIEATFRKMARLARDVAKKARKQIVVTISGRETELDRAMVDALNEPLVHLVRNAVGHGVEDRVEDRVAAGKEPAGHIVLRASHKSGSIHIEIEDDGRGLDREAILARAVEKGLTSVDADLSERELLSLVFAPGFSTSHRATEISGRGVGLDVVRTRIESLRGNVLVNSTPGQGTTFTLVLPLTTAIIDGMAVRVEDETYTIPVLSIVESLRPAPGMVSTVTGRGEVIEFRGRLLPLFRLSDLFDASNEHRDPCQGIVVVVEEAGRRTALLVDELLGQQQTVIKSLGDFFGNVVGVSGASIMADGKPGLILDVHGVTKLATDYVPTAGRTGDSGPQPAPEAAPATAPQPETPEPEEA